MFESLATVGSTPGRESGRTDRGSLGMGMAAAVGVVLVLATGPAAATARDAPSAASDAALATRPLAAEDAARVDAWLRDRLPELLETYRHLHAHPELSLEERETARFMADAFAEAGYAVERGIGGFGLIGVLRNGDGPTLLLRGDMDALPVTEETGLPFASRVRTTDAEGDAVGVMHACGHDVHMTNLVGTARLLAAMQEHWRGTLVVLAQPAEEIGRGALAMIEDGLFDRIPRPDAALALHVEPDLPAGRIGLVPGWAAANVDSVDVTIHGRGGHGARPHETIDPIVTAAHLVTALQTLVSRRVDPRDTAVVTVGSIHGGTRHNVIPDEVTLQLTVRSFEDGVRSDLLDGIRRLAEETCAAFECPRPPTIAVRENGTPAVYNDPELARHAEAVFRRALGAEAVVRLEPTTGGEDFGRYSRRGDFPGLLFRLGSVGAEAWRAHVEEDAPLDGLHTARYAPAAEPTLETGIRATSRLALTLLGAP